MVHGVEYVLMHNVYLHAYLFAERVERRLESGKVRVEVGDISIIMVNSFCITDWVTSITFALCSAQTELTLARIPTESSPITVTTAFI